jgi:hypothetical protein
MAFPRMALVLEAQAVMIRAAGRAFGHMEN